MNKHTAGPWSRNIAPASRYPIIFAGRNTHVAQVKTQGLNEEEIEGNCNLVAAAPDLLAALEAILDHARAGVKSDAHCRASRADIELAAMAAIRKARGEE